MNEWCEFFWRNCCQEVDYTGGNEKNGENGNGGTTGHAVTVKGKEVEV